MPLPGQRGFRCKKRHHTASFLKRGPPFDRKTIRRCRTRSEFQPRSPPPTPRAETRRHEHTRRNPTLRKEGRKGSDAIDASELGDPSGRPHARAGLAGASLEKKKKKNSPSPPVARSNSETAPPTAAGREGRHSPRVLSREGEKRKKMFSLASANCRRHGNGLPLQPHPPLLLLRCSDGVHARTLPKLAGNSPPCRFSTFLPFARFAFFLYFFRKEGKIPTAGDANFSEQH